MNMYDINELSTTSESENDYLVDSRYCRTAIKCKRKALKKTIKLIHGRCVVIYRGSGDLLPIAAKDADRNCYCDFVFVCHDPKPTKLVKETSTMSRSRSAVRESSTSDDGGNENTFQKRFPSTSNNKRLSKHSSFSFKTKTNDNNYSDNTNASNTTGKESCATKYIDNNENERSNEQSILEEIDVDVDELIDADEPSASILYFPSSYIKPMSNIIDDASR